VRLPGVVPAGARHWERMRLSWLAQAVSIVLSMVTFLRFELAFPSGARIATGASAQRAGWLWSVKRDEQIKSAVPSRKDADARNRYNREE